MVACHSEQRVASRMEADVCINAGDKTLLSRRMRVDSLSAFAHRCLTAHTMLDLANMRNLSGAALTQI